MSELQQAINEMRNMRESYDQLGAAAEAYNVGKMELAAAITGKGVETSPTESYPEMAKKVNAISQESYTIQGGEIYGNQLFGEGSLWNLYDILMQLLSDGRLVQYGGILLAEYYRGYDSLALAGAGAGGAYVVSDKDEHGNFKMYTEDTTHTWATEFDGKGNRWVAYCFADEYHDFIITDTNTCPRSIYIGRKVGVLSCLVAGRIDSIVVPDGNELTDIRMSNTQNYGQKLVVNNLKEHTSGIIANSMTTNQLVFLSLGFKSIKAKLFDNISNISAISFLELEEIYPPSVVGGFFGVQYISNVNSIQFPKLKVLRNMGEGAGPLVFMQTTGASKLQNVYMPLLESIIGGNFYFDANATSGFMRSLYLPKLKIVSGNPFVNSIRLYDIEVGPMETNLPLNYWNPRLDTDMTTPSVIPEEIREQVLDNIYNHIALKVSDRAGLSRLTVTFSSEVKNSILAEEDQRIINKFIEKNWQIA